MGNGPGLQCLCGKQFVIACCIAKHCVCASHQQTNLHSRPEPIRNIMHKLYAWLGKSHPTMLPDLLTWKMILNTSFKVGLWSLGLRVGTFMVPTFSLTAIVNPGFHAKKALVGWCRAKCLMFGSCPPL